MTRRLGIIAIATLILAATFAAHSTLAETKLLRPHFRVEFQDSGEEFLLIDVREDEELERDGAIAGAVHIPMGELDARMKDIPKDIPLVFY